ncbi:MAG TPA: hypothetical protein DCQ77_04680 [Betaproteobacteria bacterium]|nr:hypothetical protein [Betaproteobacteria bacterium]
MGTYILDKAFAVNTDKFTLEQKQPSITGATRLETQPTAISMKTGLQAPLADPLWLLARQWQFNEFQGEDAGTPLNLRFAVHGTRIDAFRAGSDAQQPWQALDGVPLEPRVEAEPVWTTHPRLRGEAGLHLLRMSAPALRTALLQNYPLILPTLTDAEAAADQAGLLWSQLFDRRTVDASTLRADLQPLRVDGALTGVPAALAGVADAATQALLQTWLDWYDALVYEGAADNPAWQRERMEYAFALKSGNVALDADEYTDGHLDWDDFIATTAPGDAAPTHTFSVAQRIPTPVRYPGMPAERYWEFEDGKVNFAGAEAGATDLARMCVTEFALSFGNDWFMAPVRLPVGALYRLENNAFEVVDSFGIPATVKPIQPLNQTQWEMYALRADPDLQGRLQHTLFLPDSLDGVQEGAVLEHTLLVRDEMANLAWAIEKTVQGVSGEPLDRDMEAKALAFSQQISFPAQADAQLAAPQLIYRLATPVPANWTPLLPVRKGLDFAAPLDIQLARAGMKRFYPDPATLAADDPDYDKFLANLDAQTDFITPLAIAEDAHIKAYTFYPRGWLLRRDPNQPMDINDTLLLEEEEVPRIGASLKRKFQYARSSDGRSWLWIGRSKLVGRGEAASGLRFDVTEKRKP